MPVLVIIGAGPGLGAATARRFGREGYAVALISRTQANVDRLAAQLASEGITATPNGNVAGTSVAFAGESAYGRMLHDALAAEGIHVAQLIIPGGIDGGDPLFASEALAERLWNLHAQPGPFRVTVGQDAA